MRRRKPMQDLFRYAGARLPLRYLGGGSLEGRFTGTDEAGARRAPFIRLTRNHTPGHTPVYEVFPRKARRLAGVGGDTLHVAPGAVFHTRKEIGNRIPTSDSGPGHRGSGRSLFDALADDKAVVVAGGLTSGSRASDGLIRQDSAYAWVAGPLCVRARH